MAIYLKVPFAKGGATAAGFEGWIELESLQFQVDRSISLETASLKNLPSETPKFSHFTVTKRIEDSSGGLFEQAAQGTSGHEIEIVVVETGPKPYVRYKLSDVYLAQYSVDATVGHLAERVSFAYSTIQAEFLPHNRSNTSNPVIKVVYNL
ncbi:MAG: type VI secretion system tube protein Hcp [Pseudomonadota bacterium]